MLTPLSKNLRSFQPIVCLQTKELESRKAGSQIKFGMSGRVFGMSGRVFGGRG